MEYLIIVGFSLFLIVPMIVVFYTQATSLQDDITAAQLERIGLEIIDAAEEVYYLGTPSQKHLVIYLPPNVHDITFDEDTVTFRYAVTGSIFTMPLSSELPLNLTGSMDLYEGRHHVVVQANDLSVTISETT